MTYTYTKTQQIVIATDENGKETALYIRGLANQKERADIDVTTATDRKTMIDGAIAFTTPVA